ncbi:Na+/H+ antiporter NhaA [Tamlana agarivorans]|uniref:Na+/H+ antiporter NhaA n=1 Tax=Pseudotamlana agarivorans TaxID=481183 RepID=A0ACC5U647_9FLAO|nr:Na+/H+ antiporter NhaA [Tamlana agarivorans]MBU2949776.1 Na+/H+ antiporter NhaA [Tamlana agarivorans]
MEPKNNILSPIQKFIKIESFSGILLLFAAILALAWANSPYSAGYTALWEYHLGYKSERFELYKPLILWINDGFMAVFFFLIGLEIKREFLIGELNTPKKLAFPLVGAIGGMVIPVVFFVIINQFMSTHPDDTLHGWGIPMATDIAFSLAILKVLGDKVPISLKIFLTAFAIVDDLGAVIVIALFYTGTIKMLLLGAALVLIAILYLLSYRGYFSKFVMTIFGIAIWILFLKSGVHPTLAGILLAFSVPIRQKVDTSQFLSRLEEITTKIKGSSELKEPILSAEQIQEIDELQHWTNKYQSPLQHLEHHLHDWVAYFIIPIFALANSGVILSSSEGLDFVLVLNIAVCLLLGKSIGVSIFVLLAEKLKIISIPPDITKTQVIGVSFLAGIGFTMAIFIASLAFTEHHIYVDSAKIGILIGSTISGIIGYVILNKQGKKMLTQSEPEKVQITD